MPKLPRRLFRILSESELEVLWSSRHLSGNGVLAIRNRALVAFIMDTGLRHAEVANLTLKSVDIEHRRVTVIGKGDKERQMVFGLAARDCLTEFLAIRGIDDEPLFHLKSDGIRSIFRRIQLELGLAKFHPHQLRHQFAGTMLRQGTSLELIGMMLGHEDLNTTRKCHSTRPISRMLTP
jgi:site-specific recombinase XerD